FPRIHSFIQIFITFHLVLLGWIFFRANNISDAFYIITHIIDFSTFRAIGDLGIGRKELAMAISLILLLKTVHILQDKISFEKVFVMSNKIVRWTVYYSIFYGIIFLGVFGKKEFIYFQF
ncbi:MAG: putative poly(Beta-D-mannuronate) O-acetylase, partial [uncultured bacterium]